MEGLKIAEYDPSYAKAISEMWQRSTEGWNGGHGNETEERVLTEHAATTNINTYLAVLNDEVLGYCAFSRYTEDEGALYIKLLNARFDCHGKGIGKALVKKSIERTTELGWPRLDLYTWAANTKSIPLYKKCGFFLENREDTTHLMNFIPTVMQTEAVQGYFRDADWYDDMKRKIDIEPDGRKENGFEFYEYNWEKDGKKLRMEFERKGRGLRLIETDDYIISLSAASSNLVFGKTYNAVYEIINKTGKPLDIEIRGRDDKNIRHSFNKNLKVLDSEKVEGEFYVSEIDEEVNNMKTHPAVMAEILVNGERALFKLGITPKFPAKVSLSCEDVERYRGEKINMYVNIESNLEETGVFEFELPKSCNMDFSQSKFKIEIEGNKKVSIPVGLTLNKPSIYSAELMINACPASGEKIIFKRNAAVVFRGRNAAFGGETGDKYVIANGAYLVTLNKNDNEIEVKEFEKVGNTFFFCPKLGRPYSEEFNSMKIQNVKWHFEDGKMILSGDYPSKEFRNIIVRSILKLSADGIWEYCYELRNSSENEACEDIWVNQSFVYELAGAAIPYGGKVINVVEPGMQWLEYFDCGRIDENWIFSSREGRTCGLVWPKNINIGFDSWYMYLEHSIGTIKPGEVKTTDPVYAAISTFRNWKEIRRFALKTNKCSDLNSVNDYEIDINNGNPFVGENFTVNITENRNLAIDGEIAVSSRNGAFREIHSEAEDNVNGISINVSGIRGIGDDIITIKNNLKSVSFERKSAVFYVKDMDFKSRVTEEGDLKVYSCSNGVMNIKSCPKFSSGIYSLEFNNREWLETSFPQAGPRTWFNPWFGGIQTVPQMLTFSGRTLLKEDIKAEFTEKTDLVGNRWRGIKSSMNIEHNEDFKGLQLNQYFLMLPGVPVLCHTVEIVQGMGKYMTIGRFMNSAFFKIDETFNNNWASIKNREGEITKYKAGRGDFDIYTNSSLLYGSDNVEHKIQINTDFDGCQPWGFLNTKDFACMTMRRISLPAGGKKFMPPVFYSFTKEHISDKLLKNLLNMRFE